MESIPHCYDNQDYGLCELATVFSSQGLLTNIVIKSKSLIYETSHPRLESSATGRAVSILVSYSNAFMYEVEFDQLSQTSCPVFICNRDCSTIYYSMSGRPLDWPGVGRNSKLEVHQREFYVYTADMLSCAGPTEEYGFKIYVNASTHGDGWNCSHPPTPAITTTSPILTGITQGPHYAKDPCGWSGVLCDGVAKVVGLELKAVGLKGYFPSAIASLTSLTYLDLSYNLISGTLPSVFNTATQLIYVDLTNNRLRGTLLTSLSHFSRLKSLILADNNFSGTIPVFLTQLKFLSYLSLASNKLTGKVSNNLCPLLSITDNPHIDLSNNPYLTCFEDCWQDKSQEVFRSTLTACAPSSPPTVSPTSPTVAPSVLPTAHRTVEDKFQLSNAAITGVVIGAFVGLCICICGLIICFRPRALSPEERARKKRLEELPIHKKLFYDNPPEIHDDYIVEHLSSAYERDYDGKTAVELILERILFIQISSRALFTLIEDSLPFHDFVEQQIDTDPVLMIDITNEYNKRHQVEGDMTPFRKLSSFISERRMHKKKSSIAYPYKLNSFVRNDEDVEEGVDAVTGTGAGTGVMREECPWSLLVQQDCDLAITVVDMILDKYNAFAKALAYSKDLKGRYIVDIASSNCKMLIKRRLYLHRRYELNATFEHRSATCEVWIARDYPIKTHDDKKNSNEDSKVALKFMSNRDQFVCEIQARERHPFDDKYVIGVLSYYDGDADDESHKEFRKDAVLKGFERYPYCLVMPAAEQNLSRMVQRNHIAGSDWDQIRLITKQVLICLDHIHSLGVVHGDIKPLNIVSTGATLKLIDLDAAASTKTRQYVGAKYSSLFSPPEFFCRTGKNQVILRTFVKHPESQQAVGIYPYELLPADPSFDMWSVGVLLYYLCTGSHLFLGNHDDNILDEADMLVLMSWDSDLKRKKISMIGDRSSNLKKDSTYDFVHTVKNLLSLLLYKEPEKRPSARRALDHPFITGKHPTRMLGEEPEYDVFISYRVESDRRHAEVIYDMLTAQGCRVWWDQICLEPGKKWEDGFCDGLIKSAFFVCLLSRGAINSPHKSQMNLSNLGKTSRCDNVLLEWRLAIELMGIGFIQGIYPVFIGDFDATTGVYSNYFQSGCHCTNLPSETVDAVEEKVIDHLDRHGLGQPYRDADKCSVVAIANEILSNQGGFVEGNEDKAFENITANILKMTRKI